MKLKSLCIIVMFFASNAWAQKMENSSSGAFLLSTNVGFSGEESTEGNSESKSMVTHGDVNLGYIFSSGIYLGAFYGSKNQETDTTKPKGSHYGATVGLISGGWFLNAHYLTSGKWGETSGNTNWDDGTGAQVDLGYMMRVTGPLFLGLHLTYRSITYDKKIVDDVEVIGDPLKVSEYFPAMRITLIW
jgi:hypothetical protein